MLYDAQWFEDDVEEQEWLEQVEYEVSNYIEEETAAGFLTADEIIAGALRGLPDGPHSLSVNSLVESLTRDALEQHLDRQQWWPKVTDCDRLDRAFAELEQAGILARHHYKCCRTCAGSALSGEIQADLAEGRSVRGYTYYHKQGTGAAIMERGLGLFFGSIEGTPEATIAIGQEVADTLRGCGLRVNWGGTADRYILVEMQWMRRRPIPAWAQDRPVAWY